ncbi:4Fe-4S binding protein [Anaeromicropila populeti]|uniref:4Fe-4S binding domain-containing protein n=1 Tax=Anaeromicropila populeti TaxID=37658 RepID=A0A1I6HLZ0_9FIRM|nr:4Fe-4S binding protein [Anaeromicropila populeti]SFR55493.1 4Fe-4S binding domain-containing protein [Anaeromicropila populeti]
MALENTGYLEYEELVQIQTIPDEERFKKGAVAVIECVQQIPCNPCEAACSRKAIIIGNPITNLPIVNGDECTGCGICVSKCPGMAIFIVNKVHSETKATVAFPYEYFPIPTEGEEVKAVNRKGEVVCDGKVIKVMNPKAFDHTPVITIEIPKEYVDQVRSIQRRRAE